MNIKAFINELQKANDPATCSQSLPFNGHLYTVELLRLIEEARKEVNGSLLESILLAASRDGLTKSYTTILCQLLDEEWHHSHEDIIMMLEEIKDPLSIEYVYKTALIVPEYDDGRSLAKKCVWALGSINTFEALEKLKILANSADSLIRETAAKELQRKFR